MRYVFLPDDLTGLKLLEFHECPVIYRSIFQDEVLPLIHNRQYTQALTVLDTNIGDSQRTTLDVHTQILSLLVHGEIYRRQGRWDEAMLQIRMALNLLEFQITSVSKHNEGVAVYTEGLCHVCTQSFDKVAATFSFAQDVLTQSARFWNYEHTPQREYACQNVVQFMEQLHQAHRQVEPGVPAVFMPLYELQHGRMTRVDVLCLQVFQHALRIEHLPTAASSIIPLNLEGTFLSALNWTSTYIAVRLTGGAEPITLGNPGDVMVMEIPPDDVVLGKAQELTGEQSNSAFLDTFSTTHDGRIVYDAQMLRLPGCDWRVIPHLLIRREELL